MIGQRILTAIIIAPLTLAGVFLLPPFGFSLFIGAVLVVSAWEWANLGGIEGIYRYAYAGFFGLLLGAVAFLPPIPVLSISLVWWLVALVLVSCYPRLRDCWRHSSVVLLMGLLALLPAWVAMVALKSLPQGDPLIVAANPLISEGNYLILLLFFIIWGADIGAYFVGRAVGKRKLAPNVSPGKSWAGFFGGVLAAVIVGGVMTLWYGKPLLYRIDGLIFLLLCGSLAMVSVLGDLTISMFKRNRDIKDSSHLLPGHGGFLDRIDSLLSAAPVLVLYLLLLGW